MGKLSNTSLISLFIVIFAFILIRDIFDSVIFQLFALLLLALAVFLIAFYLKRIPEMTQFLPIFLGFIGGLLLNSMLSAKYLASFTYWLIQTNTGAFNIFDFIKDSVFIAFMSIFFLIIMIVHIQLKNITKTEKIIYIFFGFSVISLILASINFMNQTINWLHLLPVAEHWGDRVSFDSSVIVDIIKSLFLAGLFNVLEKIARMRLEK